MNIWHFIGAYRFSSFSYFIMLPLLVKSFIILFTHTNTWNLKQSVQFVYHVGEFVANKMKSLFKLAESIKTKAQLLFIMAFEFTIDIWASIQSGQCQWQNAIAKTLERIFFCTYAVLNQCVCGNVMSVWLVNLSFSVGLYILKIDSNNSDRYVHSLTLNTKWT